MQTHKRLDKLQAIMRNERLDIVALIPGATLRYLTGGVHYVMERPIVEFISLDDPPVAVIPQLEVPLFKAKQMDPRIVSWTDAEGYDQAFRTGLDMLHPAGKTIGVEGTRMRFFEGEVIRRWAAGATVIAADEQLARLRVHKDDDEIDALRRAVEISEQALKLTLDAVRVGMSEIELADILETHMKALGSEEPSFKTILHGGRNTALPHSGPLPYRIQRGDPLLIDFGAVYQGYRADITRVVFVGEPGPEFRHFYAVVQAANAAGRAAAGPGVAAEAVDIAAKSVLIEAGYGRLIRHRTGHGIGLESHEAPYIVEGNKLLLEPGMVFTVEPGIYDMNAIGVRIEDDVLITGEGAESISTFSRDIIVVPG
ncbi:MAG TPA: Xaa-Pro peptidase family protein [Chloroflexia bacterium]|nr:Xaa-Pro peptidase family protein [Chloroflexia bacterium]